MTAVLTYRQFCELASDHPLTGLDNSPYVGDVEEEPPSGYWLGYVPVMWEDGIEFDPAECDDFKEVGPFLATFRGEAEKFVRAVYGPYAEVEAIDL